jgi:hypothetical protein
MYYYLFTSFNSIQFRVSFPFILNFNFRVPVDPLEWQISQDTANTIVASLANTIGAAESVLRVAATGHDKRLFIKVFQFSYYYCYFLTSYLFTFNNNIAGHYLPLCIVCSWKTRSWYYYCICWSAPFPSLLCLFLFLCLFAITDSCNLGLIS